MEREVVFAPEDILDLYDYVAIQAGAARARAYTGQIVSYCLGFALFPERGRRRDDLRLGLRIVGFGRRVTIAFHVTDDRVTIVRVLYGGCTSVGHSATARTSSAPAWYSVAATATPARIAVTRGAASLLAAAAKK